MQSIANFNNDMFSLKEQKEDTFLTELFHENTKLSRSNYVWYGAHINAIVHLHYFVEKMAKAGKSYPGCETVSLPTGYRSRGLSLEECIQKRRSIREYAPAPVELAEISHLLHYSYGVTGRTPIPKAPNLTQLLRAAPSGGALYPLEIYLVLFNVSGVQPGLYHYEPRAHLLETLKEGDLKEQVRDIFMIDNLDMKNAGLMFIITTVFERTLFKYRDRGYRFILMEAGHVAEHFTLMAVAMNMGSVLVGGFMDDELNRFLGVGGKEESALYAGVIGKI